MSSISEQVSWCVSVFPGDKLRSKASDSHSSRSRVKVGGGEGSATGKGRRERSKERSEATSSSASSSSSSAGKKDDKGACMQYSLTPEYACGMLMYSNC